MGASGERRIRIDGLRCPGRHGAYPGERELTRTFLVDIQARGTLREDDVETIAGAARAAVATRSHALLERAAWEVAGAVLDAAQGIAEVEVRVTKPDPTGLGAASEAVALTRSRAARAPSAPHGPQGGRRAPG